MTADCFFDTNILLYAFSTSEKAKEAEKIKICLDLINTKSFIVSTQVVMEFYNSATKKAHLNIPKKLAKECCDLFLEKCVAVTPEVIQNAFDLVENSQISHWDGAIIAAAKAAGIALVYTEDLNHNQLYDGVRVINPFLTPTI